MIPHVRLAVLLGALVLVAAACPSGGVDVVVGEGEGEGEGEPAEGEGEPAEGEGEPAEGEGEGEPAEGEGEGEPAEGEGEGEPSTGIGTFADPIVVDSFPFHDERNTTAAPGPGFDVYSCSSANEGGDAFVYRVVTSERGVLSVHVADDAAAGVDIDVHLLSSASADACVARANTDLSTVVDAGSHLVVADTYASGGDPQAGPFGIDFTFSPLEGGNCETESSTLRMFWSSCPAGLAGCDDSGADTVLTLPILGNLVKEAHLVTEEDGFGNSWPTSFTDGINEHWALSQAATGYLMTRDQPWAPAGEGGSEFGQGATSVPLPVLDEAWYINMYWRDRPARGTRMILKNPANGRAVVASAGWETGPGSNSWVGGATEEVLDWLQRGSGPIELGFAVDQTLPFGPIDCP